MSHKGGGHLCKAPSVSRATVVFSRPVCTSSDEHFQSVAHCLLYYSKKQRHFKLSLINTLYSLELSYFCFVLKYAFIEREADGERVLCGTTKF